MENVYEKTILPLLTTQPSRSLSLAVDSNLRMDVDRTYYLETFKEYYLYMASPAEQAVHASLLNSKEEHVDVVPLLTEFGSPEEMWRRLFVDCIQFHKVAIFDTNSQQYIPEVTRTRTGVMEDYRTGHGEIEYVIPSGFVLQKDTWAS